MEPIPGLARYLTFSEEPGGDVREALGTLCDLADGHETVVGVGRAVVMHLGQDIAGLRVFPSLSGPGLDVPSTSGALWCWLRSDDRGDLYHRSAAIKRSIADAFRLNEVIDAFRYGPGLDLTGYEDGTENPKGDAAYEAAIVTGSGEGLDGSSFVAVQQWLHDFDVFAATTSEEQDNTFGRRKKDNEELEDAPPSAHIKRTEQESFDPEAFVVRRSMSWADGMAAGLVFVAFGKSLNAFESQLLRMVGVEDRIVDALFQFTRPTTGAYYWCPPLKEGRLDLSALGL